MARKNVCDLNPSFTLHIHHTKTISFFFKTIHFKIYLRIIQLKILVVFSFKSLILFLKRKNYSLIFKFNLLDNLLEISPFKKYI